MDITKRIADLESERDDQYGIKTKAHERIIEINKLLKSARILERDAKELLGEKLGVEEPEKQ